MTSMNQVGSISQLTQVRPMFLQTAQQQVTTRAPIIGKFFASEWDCNKAWERFESFNTHMIVQANRHKRRFYMQDGTVYCYRVIAEFDDVFQIAGAEYYSVDVDREIVDPKILNYIRTRVRWCH